MTWNNDTHGLVCRIAEAKCYRPGHSWAMKLSQLQRQPNAKVRIATYSLNAELAYEILSRRPHTIRILCNARFEREAEAIRQRLPGIAIRTADSMHAKLCLIAPSTVYLGSENFVRSSLDDIVVGLRSEQVHDYWAAWFDEMFAMFRLPDIMQDPPPPSWLLS
jgi:PLD-like domain